MTTPQLIELLFLIRKKKIEEDYFKQEEEYNKRMAGVYKKLYDEGLEK